MCAKVLDDVVYSAKKNEIQSSKLSTSKKKILHIASFWRWRPTGPPRASTPQTLKIGHRTQHPITKTKTKSSNRQDTHGRDPASQIMEEIVKVVHVLVDTFNRWCHVEPRLLLFCQFPACARRQGVCASVSHLLRLAKHLISPVTSSS